MNCWCNLQVKTNPPQDALINFNSRHLVMVEGLMSLVLVCHEKASRQPHDKALPSMVVPLVQE